MKKSLKRKILISTLASFAFVGILTGLLVFSKIDDSVTYSYFKVDATILKNGDVRIKENYKLETNDIHYQNRKINLQKSSFSVNYQADIDDLTIKINDGNNEYSRSKEDSLNTWNNNRSILIAFEGEVDDQNEFVDIYSDKENYSIYVDSYLKNADVEVTYTLKNMIDVYDDFASINWKFLSEYDTNKKNVEVNIHYPESNFDFESIDKQEEDFQNKIYYYGYGSSNATFKEPTNNVDLNVKSDYLSTSEEIEIHTYFPASILNIDKTQYKGYKNGSGKTDIQKVLDIGRETNAEVESIYNTREMFKNIIVTALCILGILFIGLYIFFYRRVYYKYDKEYKSDFDLEFYRELPSEIPPAILGYMYHEEEISQDDLSATMMNMIYKGYISVDSNNQDQTEKDPNFKYIFHKDKDRSSLSNHEKYFLSWYFDIMFPDKNEVTLNEIDETLKIESKAILYQKCNDKWNKILKSDADEYKFFEKSAETGARKYFLTIVFVFIYTLLYVLGVGRFDVSFFFALPLLLVVGLGTSFVFYISSIKRRSKKGNEEYVRWKAFEHFLREFSSLEDYPITSIEIWDHYLVYATVFGIADLVEKQLRTKYVNYVDFDESIYYTHGFYYGYYCRRRFIMFNHVSRSTIVAANEKRMAARGGGMSSRGGFGGGSSFGGGGSHSSFR